MAMQDTCGKAVSFPRSLSGRGGSSGADMGNAENGIIMGGVALT